MIHSSTLPLTAALLLFASALYAQMPEARFESPYFEFAREADSVAFKATVQQVPDYVDDGMLYYCRHGVYNGRQVVLKGVTTQGLVLASYGTSNPRTIWKAELPEGRWIAEIIVPEADDELLDRAQREAVEETLRITGSKEMRVVPVFKLTQTADRPIGFPEADGLSVRWSQKDGEISGEGLTIRMLARVIERMTDSRPVLTEIDSGDRFEVELRWTPGDIEDLRVKLRERGLELEDAEAEVEVLVVTSDE